LIRDLQTPQTAEQAALTLAALLCYQRLLPYSSDDATNSIRGDYLADFDALINGEPLTNKRMAFEQMMFSFLRAINAFKIDYQVIRQLLATVLDKDSPALEPSYRLLDQYWICKMKNRLSHKDALVALKHT
jgi:hypothetical protein